MGNAESESNCYDELAFPKWRLFNLVTAMAQDDTPNQQRANAAARYKPQRVRLLLVAQTPPANAPRDPPRYFYFEKVSKHDDLFRGVIKAILGVEPIRHQKASQLAMLRDQGVFLIDLKPDPSDPLPLDSFVPALIERCRQLLPDHIILMKADVYDAAFAAAHSANLPVIDARIPFPGSGRQAEFAQAMSRALNVAKWSLR